MADIEKVIVDVVGKQLLGELLTIADSVSPDKEQRNGIKSLIRQSVQKCQSELRRALSD
ncbi:MAG: hypothetical protein M0P29_14005 [Sphaerochaetaceae bacterium]|jgi:hypothetical protein|nr:hypothetical protein [Sphaerochaetaceae bacterium]